MANGDEPTLIRVLSEIDVETFWRLRLRALQEEPESFCATYEESVETSLEEVAQKLKSSDESFILGARLPELVGMLGFYRRPGLKRRHTGVIWGMYVAPEKRGRGLGKALLSEAIKHASLMSGLKQLALTVMTTRETARCLYLSMGFQSYGTEPQALKLGNRYLDEELMLLKL